MYYLSYQAWLIRPGPVLFFTVLAMVAECLHVRLPHVNGYVSVGFAICLAALLSLGVPETVFVASIGTAVANLFHAFLPLDAVIFNAGQMAVTVYAAGMVWQMLGGQPGTALTWSNILPLLAAVAVYAVVNVTLVTVGISLALRKRVLRTWLSSIKWVVPNYVILGLLGVLAAGIYGGSLGMLGVLLMWLPFLFARYSFQQYWAIREAHLKTVEALAAALDARDPRTLGHSERVAAYARAVAVKLNLPDEEVEKVHFAGLLHDIGKIGISDFVLNKNGKLTNDEFSVIRKHPEMGADMVRSIGFLKDVSDIIRYHHERVDGSGYPVKLTGAHMPLGSRLIAVADAYDAMTSDRVYRDKMTPAEAVRQLVEGKGTQFDPEVVDTFLQIWHDELQEGSNIAPPSPGRHADPSALALTERKSV